MKYSTAFVALVGSIVLTPGAMSALINDSAGVKPQAIMMPKATVSESPSCASLVEGYYTANDTNDSLRHLINKCTNSPAANEATLRLPSPKLLMVSLPPVASGAVKRGQLPSLEIIKQAAASMDENVLKLSEHRTEFTTMKLSSKVDFMFCSIKGTGALCDHAGRFFPASLALRTFADILLRLFSKEIKLDRAVNALDTVNTQKAELVQGMSKMLNALVAEYPTTKQDTKDIAKWLKSYRLVQANINVISRILDLPLVEPLPKSIVVAGSSM